MTAQREYPDEPVGPFEEPPLTIHDVDFGEISIDRMSGTEPGVVDSLVAMYADFDSADRAQGLPPVKRPAIEDWLDVLLERGPDIVALNGDRVVGHATLVPDNDGAYELAIFVHQDFRGIGIGTALLETLLGSAAAAGIDRIWLTVERWNSVAIRLYKSVGFERTGGGSFELEMSLRLDTQTASTG